MARPAAASFGATEGCTGELVCGGDAVPSQLIALSADDRRITLLTQRGNNLEASQCNQSDLLARDQPLWSSWGLSDTYNVSLSGGQNEHFYRTLGNVRPVEVCDGVTWPEVASLDTQERTGLCLHNLSCGGLGHPHHSLERTDRQTDRQCFLRSRPRITSLLAMPRGHAVRCPEGNLFRRLNRLHGLCSAQSHVGSKLFTSSLRVDRSASMSQYQTAERASH
ncbi:hypothetical protein EYF80_002908 [Liparis tanakae]|uniref:Uncharacterized protein n=1 Tax=Liparis tanakae TaxID=230148 RepID=A0A4Z2J8N1_9TELE|nr:hypothetical protein EYF80_002908 [Liparis tanakae]